MDEEKSISREGYLRENYRCFHLRDEAGQERDFHFHDFDKLVILLGGRVDYLVENMTYRLRPWDILLIKHHAIHKALIDQSEPYERVILYLDGRYVDRAMPEVELMDCFERADKQGRYLLTPSREERSALSQALEAMERAMADDQYGAQALRDALLIQLLVQINRIGRRAEQAQERPQGRYDDKISRALSYINENLQQELTVERLAEQVFLSKYHFMRLFKMQTGTTVHAYVRQKRLLYAAQLIRKGVPVGQAAVESGFSEYSTFYRAFQNSFGISPAQLK
jgi:AraC-like DNA-binding protein